MIRQNLDKGSASHRLLDIGEKELEYMDALNKSL